MNQVRQYGQYESGSEAERVTRTVLSELGCHLTGDERADLARSLPTEAAARLVGGAPAERPLTAAAFVRDVAARMDGATEATARWDVSSVLCVVAETADTELVNRVIGALPPGYALLFGRAELARAA
ncbi:DUF2267 domain-containing protein [Streptomyces sp. NBC_01803]|uniref:DUF2267 domain-containing protein n=1 Tax=Streptomyces sp. NBC_01803 TaxID=2975946 RepID=UPI002DDB3657|nr:DUF2267 domain-containing protein [Streptomyces sp. NBC_01803]